MGGGRRNILKDCRILLLHPATDHVTQPEHHRRRLFHFRGNGIAPGVDEDGPALAVRVAWLPPARRMVLHFHPTRAPPPLGGGGLLALVLGGTAGRLVGAAAVLGLRLGLVPRKGATGPARTVPMTVPGMAAGPAPVRYHRYGEGQEQNTKYNAHRHLDVPFGVLQVHQQCDDMVAQCDPEGDGADGKEATKPKNTSRRS